jgi:hypothetical protein
MAIQVPVHVPVNVCHNTVNVIGLLNPVFGNTCVNNKHRRIQPGLITITATLDLTNGVYLFQTPADLPVDICGKTDGFV